MEKNTKILIGVGIAAVAAYFVYRSKSKAKTQTGGEAQTGGAGGAVKGKCPEGFFYVQPLPPIFQPKPKPLPVSSKCPAGSSEQVVMCIKAPCPSICFDNKTGDMVRPINDENDYDSEYREPVDLGKNPINRKPNPFTDELFNQMPIYLQK